MTVRSRRGPVAFVVRATIAAILVVGCASAGPSAAPISAGPGDVVIEANTLAFTPTTVTASTGAPITIILRNRERTVPHNVELRKDGESVYKGDLVTGPADIAYQVGPLEAGSYQFICTVHPTMTGTIVVE